MVVEIQNPYPLKVKPSASALLPRNAGLGTPIHDVTACGGNREHWAAATVPGSAKFAF
jgi:hypothetical protein